MLQQNMKWSSAILIFLSSVTQGRVVYSSLRIINGTDVEVGEIPFQVSLQFDSHFHSIFHFCGGSILNENYVITAAHCVVDLGRPLHEYKVVVGTVDFEKPGQVRKFAQVIVHENFDGNNYSYGDDIALIRLDVPLNFSELVKPVPLPDMHQNVPAGSAAVVSGWGSVGWNHDDLSRHLQKAQIWIVDQDYCVKVIQEKHVKIIPTQICANDPQFRRGQCHGDSGGPLMVDGKMVGIVSWSIKDPYCASTKYPGVFTRVPEYIDWIQKHAV